METFLVVVHLFLAIGLVGLILVQHGKGADMGAAFGSGASGTVFGSSGAGNFLSRTTAILATAFFLTSLVLAYFAMQARDADAVPELADPAPGIQEVSPDLSTVPDATAPADDMPAIPVEVAPADDVPDIPVEAAPVDDVPDISFEPSAPAGVPAAPQ